MGVKAGSQLGIGQGTNNLSELWALRLVLTLAVSWVRTIKGADFWGFHAVNQMDQSWIYLEKRQSTTHSHSCWDKWSEKYLQWYFFHSCFQRKEDRLSKESILLHRGTWIIWENKGVCSEFPLHPFYKFPDAVFQLVPQLILQPWFTIFGHIQFLI